MICISNEFYAQGEMQNGKKYYYATDHLGSVTDLLDINGTNVASIDYTPYGRKLRQTGTVQPTFGYAGMMEHQPSGLNLTWYRGYDAKVGRWLSEDPIGFNGGVNLYGYVGGDPISRIDLLGLTDITYDNNSRALKVTDRNGNVVGTYPAANNAQRSSRGPWAGGTYNYAYPTTHSDDAPNSQYGSNGNFVFIVPGCRGCGVHSGRANSRDRAGRSGTEYATNGCIRTTDDATRKIKDLIQSGDPLRTITVIR